MDGDDVTRTALLFSSRRRAHGRANNNNKKDSNNTVKIITLYIHKNCCELPTATTTEAPAKKCSRNISCDKGGSRPIRRRVQRLRSFVRVSACARARVRLSPPPRPARPTGYVVVKRCVADLPYRCRRPCLCSAAYKPLRRTHNEREHEERRNVKNTPRMHSEPETGQSYHSRVRGL